MKLKIIVLMLICLLLSSFLLAGCFLVPEEYTKGIKLDRSYPEDDFPIIEDSVIFYCESDDESVTVKYGTTEDIDYIADFYKDFFDDNGIVPEDETDKSSKYAAKGSYKDFFFDIRTSNPAEGYESKLFSTIVKIEIEFTETPLLSLEERLIGFWRSESIDEGTGLSLNYDKGIGINFNADGTADSYYNFLYESSAGWAASGEDTVIFTAEGEDYSVTVTLEQKDSKEYLYIQAEDSYVTFFRDSSEGFSKSNPDTDLTSALADKTWYYVLYSDSSGETYSGSSGHCIYYSSGTFEESYEGIEDSGTWYVSGAILYCVYDDGTSISWPIEITAENAANYLYFYSSTTQEYWLYSDQQQTSYSFTDITWYGYSYVYADGSIESYINTDAETMTFYSDNTMLCVQSDGSEHLGTWDINGTTITAQTGSTNSIWDIGTEEYNGINYLYLSDYSEEFKGGYWVFTDVPLIYGSVVLPSDEKFIQAIVDGTWYSTEYRYADGTTEEMSFYSIIFYPDGTLNEYEDSNLLTGTWSYSDGTLYMEYPSYQESLYYPDTYIEYNPESNSMTLYMGDCENGGHWLFTTYQP